MSENKVLENESEDYKLEINTLQRALRNSKKEIKDVSHKLEKKIETLEDKVKDLNDFKISQI